MLDTKDYVHLHFITHWAVLFVCETAVGRRKESNDLELGQRRLLRAWESVLAGRPRATAHLQSFVQKTLIQKSQSNKIFVITALPL